MKFVNLTPQMKFVNLTPHSITVSTIIHRPWCDPDGEDWGEGERVIEASGEIARVEVREKPLEPLRR